MRSREKGKEQEKTRWRVGQVEQEKGGSISKSLGGLEICFNVPFVISGTPL